MTYQQKIDRLYTCFFSIINHAYKKKYLLPNQVLSKQLIWGDTLNKYLFNDISGQANQLKILLNVIYGIFANIYGFLVVLLNKLVFELSCKKKQMPDAKIDLFIDTYFLKNTISTNGNFQDPYFPSLTNVLDKKEYTYVYTPKWIGSNNPIVLQKVFKALENYPAEFITEYHVFTLADYLKLFLFSISYSIKVLFFSRSILDQSYEEKTIKYALLSSLKASGVYGYSRYLFGRRLSDLASESSKCISWYENQAIDKCFYKGLRRYENRVKIYGAQLLIRPSGLLNLLPDENEACFDVLPDVVLVNGPHYVPRQTRLNYRIGPSLRYKKVFESPVNGTCKKDILVLLPYNTLAVEFILDQIFLLKPEYKKRIVLKFHPTTEISKFKRYIKGLRISHNDIYELFSETFVVIGSESGALAEAIAQKIPVIYIEQPFAYSHNPLPEVGRGDIWETADNQVKIEILIEKFFHYHRTENDILSQYAVLYKKILFSAVNEDEILKQFDL